MGFDKNSLKSVSEEISEYTKGQVNLTKFRKGVFIPPEDLRIETEYNYLEIRPITKGEQKIIRITEIDKRFNPNPFKSKEINARCLSVISDANTIDVKGVLIPYFECVSMGEKLLLDEIKAETISFDTTGFSQDAFIFNISVFIGLIMLTAFFISSIPVKLFIFLSTFLINSPDFNI